MQNSSEMLKVQAIIDGFGPGFLEKNFTLRGFLRQGRNPSQVSSYDQPTPALGRYIKSVEFMKKISSQQAIGTLRLKIMVEYFIFLNDWMLKHHKSPESTIFTKLSDEQRVSLRAIASNPDAVVQAEYIERFTDHDTAAAGDYLKIAIAIKHPELEPHIEGIHFAATSEDVMANVFGIMANNLVNNHFMSALQSLCNEFIAFSQQLHEKDGPLILPGQTHEQPAEITTLGQKIAVRLGSIIQTVQAHTDSSGEYHKFSGKIGGAIGNLSTHYAAYPDLPWEEFADSFVENLGLHYEQLTDQSVSYAREAQILITVANILSQVIKLVDDFIKMARAPAQLFVKKKKKGQKGSSLMPNKSNAWASEGAIAMLRKSQNALEFTARELQRYPDEGNMARSFLMRDLGSDFIYIFIAFNRIARELASYVPNRHKINAFLSEYPGMAGSLIQTVLKREGVVGDPYRMIQEISINQDGTYANATEFRDRLANVLDILDLPDKVRQEILFLTDPNHQAQRIHNKAHDNLHRIKSEFERIARASASKSEFDLSPRSS